MAARGPQSSCPPIEFAVTNHNAGPQIHLVCEDFLAPGWGIGPPYTSGLRGWRVNDTVAVL